MVADKKKKVKAVELSADIPASQGRVYLFYIPPICYFRNTIIRLSIFSRDSHLISLCSFIYRTAVYACMIVLSYRISFFI